MFAASTRADLHLTRSSLEAFVTLAFEIRINSTSTSGGAPIWIDRRGTRALDLGTAVQALEPWGTSTKEIIATRPMPGAVVRAALLTTVITLEGRVTGTLSGRETLTMEAAGVRASTNIAGIACPPRATVADAVSAGTVRAAVGIRDAGLTCTPRSSKPEVAYAHLAVAVCAGFAFTIAITVIWTVAALTPITFEPIVTLADTKEAFTASTTFIRAETRMIRK